MSAQLFWDSAWSITARLASDPPDDAGESDLLAALKDDYVLQRYVFIFRAFSDRRWLASFRDNGLFESPPAVERVDGGVRAQGWPVLAYLRAVAPAAPLEAADLLAAIDSDNWWVISDALDIAAELPPSLAARPILLQMRQWERSGLQWTPPDTLIRSVGTIAHADSEPTALTEVLIRVLNRFMQDAANRYELAELLPQVRAELGDSVDTTLADAIEHVLLLRSADGTWRTFSQTLDSLHREEGPDLLVSEWLTSLEMEAKRLGGVQPLTRAVRLINSATPLTRLMAIRGLAVSLATQPLEPQSVALLNRIAARKTLTMDYEELPELLPLFRDHFLKLEGDRQALLIQSLTDQASDDDKLGRLLARDWLGALRSRLGAREHQILISLESELGPHRKSFDGPMVVADWDEPRASVTLAELESMPLPDLVGHLRHVPLRPGVEWPYRGSSTEGFARLMQPLVRDRLDQLAPHLAQLASSTEDAAILFFLCWGVRDAFGEDTTRTADRLPFVRDFIAVIASKIPSMGALEHDFGSYSPAKALADLIESLGGWLVDTPNSGPLVDALGVLLQADDPSQTEDNDDGMDPPSRAINSVRGEAVLAALRMLSTDWSSRQDERAELVSSIEGLLVTSIASEHSPAVLSSYGRYLPAIVTFWPSFFSEHRGRLLPMDDDLFDQWAGAFVTYLTFNGPHRATADSLRNHYEAAVERLPDAAGSYLGKQSDRLLMHLLALSLPFNDEWDAWIELLHDGLTAAEPSAAARSIHDLAFAVEREGLEIPAAWVLSFANRRANAISDTMEGTEDVSKRGELPDALLELLFACAVVPTEAIGVVRHLAELGAQLKFAEVVKYLTNCDSPRSHSGALMLQISAASSTVGYMREAAQAKDLLMSYALDHSDLAWSTVNILGANAAFAFEDAAISIRELLSR